MSLDKIRQHFHERFLDTRALDAILMSDKFAGIWEDSDVDEQHELWILLYTNDKVGLQKVMDKVEKKELEGLSTNKLKEVAQKLRVPKYSRSTRTELIRGIQRKEKEVEDGKSTDSGRNGKDPA